MKDQRHGLNDVFRIHCHKNHIGERELKNIVNTMLSLALLPSIDFAQEVLHGMSSSRPFSAEKNHSQETKCGTKIYHLFIEKSHKTLHKNYTNTSWKSKHSSLLVMLSCLCFPVLLQVLSACCSANCAKCDVVPASVVKNNRR